MASSLAASPPFPPLLAAMASPARAATRTPATASPARALWRTSPTVTPMGAATRTCYRHGASSTGRIEPRRGASSSLRTTQRLPKQLPLLPPLAARPRTRVAAERRSSSGADGSSGGDGSTHPPPERADARKEARLQRATVSGTPAGTRGSSKTVAEEARGYLEKAEEDFIQFTQHLGRALVVTTIPGVALETLRELSGSRVQGWDVVWFCWAAGLVLGCMVGVGEVMQKHQRRRAAARLPPRRVVLTGGSRGLGKALAREFLLAGDDVLLTSRSEAGVEEALRALQEDTWHITGRAPLAVLVKKRRAEPGSTESTQSSREVWDLVQSHEEKRQEQRPNEQCYQELSGRRQRVVGVACDVRLARDVQMLADVARKELGRVDIWVNNAGTNPMAKPFVDFEDHELEQVVSTNLLGSLLCTRAAMRLIQQQPCPPGCIAGHVFNLEGAGSWGGATPQYAAYGATKCALRQLGASLGGVRGGRVGIHAASPGLVLTDLLLSGATVANKQAFNIVGEHPETVARVLVPQMRTVKGTGSTVSYLTPPRIVLAILSAWLRRGRWFDAQGQAVYATEAQRLRSWAEGRDKSPVGAVMDAVPSTAWLALASSSLGAVLVVVSMFLQQPRT
ncbi:hypothetical protein CLOP_g11795 [Closterium sp. NIES-67]|nr:hypothetical protein CLOP_g11795 [Closterium sp. NIES-67]